MSRSFAAIIGGVAGVLASVVIVIVFIWFCISHCKNFSNRNSETGSSDPSALVEWNKGGGSSLASGPTQGSRQFTLEELGQATKHFSERNLIGDGIFGLVYKGLLSDGIVVAIKRRIGSPKQEFVEEVNYLSEILHRNLVTVLGYCQEDGLQMLVFEYLPNGSVCSHLYDTGQDSTGLDFKQRLSIALAAAKGLCHLHGLSPPLAHKHFKTSKVLVDENFIAKVADAGIVKLLQKIEDAGPSTQMTKRNVFWDPEVGEPDSLSAVSDVYSFGVFLLELIIGQDTSQFVFYESDESLTHWVESRIDSGELVDHRLDSGFTSEGMKELIGLTLRCLSLNGQRRPTMEIVVSVLDQIRERERAQTTVMGEGTDTVALASYLFSSG